MKNMLPTDCGRRASALAITAFTLVLVGAGEYYLKLTSTAYWLDHVLFGFGFPFLIYWMWGYFNVACGFTLSVSLYNEFVKDQLDKFALNPDAAYSLQFAHIFGDMLGFAIACMVFVHYFIPPRVDNA